MKYIEEKAEDLLTQLKVNKLPINPKVCAEKLNLTVEAAMLEDDISGIFLAENSEYYIIYNKNEGTLRQRFTIAHELGHFILHKDLGVFVDRKSTALYRNSSSATGEVLKEREANAFAAALLMPRILIEKELDAISESEDIIEILADKFKVSKPAMSFRLSNLGYELF
ncbi:ImmA/IrrE family metallo-endopeptidase [Pedobacter helvus]|uniref:ImmA/IrrE family metallo-endopeptidase n=1 Tax=Pedobacter helvus TaxID=2563444 RepID=A0ABW9JM73_9SPHI|nr:ImmA/IrrE family metallo-endopeptidase [Pedobacter ureilyticus]